MEQCLYKAVVFLEPARTKVRPFVTTLASRPDLARRVKSFDGYFYPLVFGARNEWTRNFLQRTRKADPHKFYFASVAQVLDSMINLRTLVAHEFELSMKIPSGNAGEPRRIGDLVSHLALQELIFQDYSVTQAAARCIAAEQLVAILKLQPELRTLVLPAGPPSIAAGDSKLLEKDIPMLEILHAVPDDAAIIVPGRPISSLTIRNKMGPITLETWACVSQSTRPISTLEIGFYRANEASSSLSGAAVNLKSLEKLRLTHVDRSDLVSVSGNGLYQSVTVATN